MTGKFDLTNVNNMAFYISGPKLVFETTEISTHPNSTQQESNYIYLYTTKFGTSIKIRLNRKFESTEFETMRVNCNWHVFTLFLSFHTQKCRNVGSILFIWPNSTRQRITNASVVLCLFLWIYVENVETEHTLVSYIKTRRWSI